MTGKTTTAFSYGSSAFTFITSLMPTFTLQEWAAIIGGATAVATCLINWYCQYRRTSNEVEMKLRDDRRKSEWHELRMADRRKTNQSVSIERRTLEPDTESQYELSD